MEKIKRIVMDLSLQLEVIGFLNVSDRISRIRAITILEILVAMSRTPHTRDWLHAMGVRFFPVVGWAERGGGLASGHGNSVPRFHIVWGTDLRRRTHEH